MNNKVKGFLLGFCLLCAVFCSAFALYNVSGAENELIRTEQPGSENSYVLRDFEGFVAVYVETEPNTPVTVTDIQVSTLREFDRLLLQTGMRVQSHERLVMILEDLGS